MWRITPAQYIGRTALDLVVKLQETDPVIVFTEEAMEGPKGILQSHPLSQLQGDNRESCLIALAYYICMMPPSAELKPTEMMVERHVGVALSVITELHMSSDFHFLSYVL